MRFLAFTALFLLSASLGHTQTGGHIHRPHPHRHAEYAKVKNPVQMTEDSIATGQELYEKHCIGCHGEGAKGSSRIDLSDDLWIHGDSDGEIFHVITDGVKGTPMTGYRKRLSKDMRWHLVNYLKSLHP